MKTYTIKVDVKMTLEARDHIDPYTVLDEMGYDFKSRTIGAYINNTEITDSVIIPNEK